MSMKLTFNMNEETDFTFDSSKVEFDSGVAKIKSIKPANITFYANYDTTGDAIWYSGNNSVNYYDTATISGGYLINNYAYYSQTNANLEMNSQGCLRIKIQSKYDGTPTSSYRIFRLGEASDPNEIELFHNDDGQIRVILNDNTGTHILDEEFGAVNLSLDEDYEIEFDYNLTEKKAYIFINGDLLGTKTWVNDYTRDSTAAVSYVYVGGTDIWVDYVATFKTQQHCESYSCGTEIASTLYTKGGTTLKTANKIPMSVLTSISEVVSKAGSDDIKYQIEILGQSKYWDGVEWSDSDGSYAQSNSYSVITTNSADLVDPSTSKIDGQYIKVIACLYSDDGSTTPSLNQLEVDYKLGYAQPDAPVYVTVYGYTNILTSETKPDLTITYWLEKYGNKVKSVIYNSNRMLINSEQTVDIDSATGYFEINVVNTDLMESGCYYVMKIENDYFYFTVENTASKINLAEVIRPKINTVFIR